MKLVRPAALTGPIRRGELSYGTWLSSCDRDYVYPGIARVQSAVLASSLRNTAPSSNGSAYQVPVAVVGWEPHLQPEAAPRTAPNLRRTLI